MSKETLEMVQMCWRQIRRDSAVVGELLRLNLRKVNPALAIKDSKKTKNLLDYLLLQMLDDVINRLNEEQELIRALRNFYSLFELSGNKREELEQICEVIVLTVEQIIDDSLTLKIKGTSAVIKEKFSKIEPRLESVENRDQWISYIRKCKNN